jgi:undecaprenyl-diphosphatase
VVFTRQFSPEGPVVSRPGLRGAAGAVVTARHSGDSPAYRHRLKTGRYAAWHLCEDGAVLRDDTPTEERIGSRDLTHWRTRGGARLARWVVDHATGLARWGEAHVVPVVTALVGGVVAVALTGVAAEVYDAVTEADGIAGLDQPVLDQAIAWRSPGLDHAVTLYTDVGGPVGMPVVATLLTLLMVWRWRSRTPLVLMLIAAAGSLAMTTTGKALIGRSRPPLSDAVPPYESSPSFPSGHTLNATVITAVLVYLLLRRLESPRARAVTVVLGAVFVLSMGLSRVFLGHHWLTDVVAGWALGLGWAALVITAHRLFLTVRRSAPRERHRSESLMG